MNSWLNTPAASKVAIYNEISSRTGMASHAVEKDWWVVQVLSVIFEMDVSKHLVFKGGTSLSKAWNLIERFSEDIDLAIDRSFFGFNGELSKKQITALRKAANKHISETFYPELQQLFADKGLTGVNWVLESTTESDQDPKVINLYYPSVIPHSEYIHPRVQIEIGCRSLIEPFSMQEISSLVDTHFPDLFNSPAVVIPVVQAERTLLEKIMLLHEEFSKPHDQIRVNRLSRHLYDVYKLSKTETLDKAIKDKSLYEVIVNHRHRFTKIGGVDYHLHQPQSINPIPPDAVIDVWKQDYRRMQEEMIYAESPDFDNMISDLKLLKKRLNEIEWTVELNF
ncbi:MAG: nucleotidyl transferase AbiEii/AbiGii toxin family protein [Fluviicola sp.]|nr:nucleotidyl transferase AbiEii/AbiGii toxin family protein [Fluviicola sp.]